MCILNRKQYLKKWVEKNNLDDNVAFAINDNGYLSDEINFE